MKLDTKGYSRQSILKSTIIFLNFVPKILMVEHNPNTHTHTHTHIHSCLFRTSNNPFLFTFSTTKPFSLRCWFKSYTFVVEPLFFTIQVITTKHLSKARSLTMTMKFPSIFKSRFLYPCHYLT